MSVTSGQWAEGVAADYLHNRGYEIVSRNWKNRWCEIDIVAKKDKSVHFVEVKYRKDRRHGSGLDYITRRKAKQMTFAALQWVTDKEWSGDYQLDVIAVEGSERPKITYSVNAVGF